MRPSLQFLDDILLKNIISEAYSILCEIGIKIDHEKARNLLLENGARTDSSKDRIFYSEEMIQKALETTPSSFKLYNVHGDQATDFTGSKIHFNPGSSALTILDPDSQTARDPVTGDYTNYVKVNEQLDNIASQSTAMIPSDVPQEISDSYRLFLSLFTGSKPVVTGIFRKESLPVMIEFQKIIRGSVKSLKEKPLTIFTACPITPLQLGDEAIETIFGCGEYGIPVEIVAMPLSGFNSPVTLSGTLIQHAAEVLSGVVLAQLANPGTPLLYGSSSAIFDVRYETTPMGAIESMMLGCGVNEIGSKLGFPTQAYLSLSDTKLLDAQTGLESGMGASLAAMSGINNISGPGMMDFISCFSIEKLILDNEICGMALRMAEGITSRGDIPIKPLMEELLSEDHLIISDHSLEYLPSEHYQPGNIIDRKNRSRWEADESLSLFERAANERKRLLDSYTEPGCDSKTREELKSIMTSEAKKYGMDTLPV